MGDDKRPSARSHMKSFSIVAIDEFKVSIDAVAKVKENHKRMALNPRARGLGVSEKTDIFLPTERIRAFLFVGPKLPTRSRRRGSGERLNSDNQDLISVLTS
jgi:hypothetical protein